MLVNQKKSCPLTVPTGKITRLSFLSIKSGFEILCISFGSGTASEVKAQNWKTLNMAFVSRLLHALLCQAQSWLLLHALPSLLASMALCQVFHINQNTTHSWMLLDKQQDSPVVVPHPPFFFFCFFSGCFWTQIRSREKSDLGVCLNCALRKAIVLESIAVV